MKQMKVLTVFAALAMTLGLSSCGKKECKTHQWGSYSVVTPATCQQEGKEERVCKKCGKKQERKIDKLEHTYQKDEDGVTDKVTWTTEPGCVVDGVGKKHCTACNQDIDYTEPQKGHDWVDDEDQTGAVAPTCLEAGTKKQHCSRCTATRDDPVQALGHDWAKAEDQTGAIAPTCTEGGTEIQHCTRCTATQEVEVEALGHDFPEVGRELDIPGPTEQNTKGEVPYHWAKITNYSCTRGDSFRYAWSAKEVNFNYKDVAEGAEPELLDEGEDGIRFWGRPIGNAMALSSEGRASSNDDEKIPDESVKGSRFEFDFEFDENLTDVCLSADLEPAQYTNDIFKNRSQDQEWTPGYRFVDDDNDPSTPKVAEKIEGMRYIIYLDGQEVDLDETVNTAPAGRKWYQFPCKLNLTQGKHNLNIAMAGGYLHTFYSFSFEKVAPAHVHNYRVGEKASDSALRPLTCTCGNTGYELQAADLTEGQKEPTETGNQSADKATRLGGNNIFDDEWNITNLPAGNYEVYLKARASSGNANAYWNAATAIANGSQASNNGNTPEKQSDYRYKVKIDDGEFVNIGSADDTAADQYSDFGLETSNPQWTTKAVCTISVAQGAAKLTIHNMDNGYTIWIYAVRLFRVAA